MYDILLVQEAHDCEELYSELSDVREGGGASDVALIVVRVQRRGAQRLKDEAVVRAVQELGLLVYEATVLVRGLYGTGSVGVRGNGVSVGAV